jgi:23S rRNA (guanosine2251-2'-O)-methyltransferase
MPGNSKRRGAVKKSGKGPTVGTGGNRRQKLEGKGPTPKAKDRPGHVAFRKAKQAEKRRPTTAGRTPGTRSARSRAGAETAEWLAGRNPVVEALRAEIPAEALYVQAGLDADERTREALQAAADRRLPILEVTKREIDRWVSGATHQGIALKVPPYEYADPIEVMDEAIADDAAPLLIALDGVTDPRNLGAIVRSAAAFGAHGVVIPSRRAAGMTATAWKASAGAATRVPVARAANLVRSLQDFQKRGAMVLGLDADADMEITSADPDLLSGPVVLVVGSEGKGLSRLVSETCDLIVSIAITSDTESLNASVAASIALHECARARRG